MKISELIDEQKKNYYGDYRTKRILRNNFNKDCVIAYIKTDYFKIVIIELRGKKFKILFEPLNEMINIFYTHHIREIKRKDFFNILSKESEKLIIVNQKSFNYLNKLNILGNLDKENNF